jgi:hypothetical protein
MTRKVEKARRIVITNGLSDIEVVPAHNFAANVEACSAALAGFKRIDPTLKFKDWEEGTTGYRIERALADAARRCRVIVEREATGSKRQTPCISAVIGLEDVECVHARAYDLTVKACTAAHKILARLDSSLVFAHWEDAKGGSITNVLALAGRKCKAVAEAELGK